MGCTFNDVLLTVYTVRVYLYKASSGSWVTVVPYEIKQEGYLLRSYLVDARRMLFFMAEQVYLPMGRSGRCKMQIPNAQQRGERRPKGRETFLCSNFP